MSTNLFLDFETRSLLSLPEVGLDLYSRQAEVLMLGWAIDNRKVQLWLPHEGPMPKELEDALQDPVCLLIAHNAQFERVIFHRVLGKPLDFSRWRDTMVLAYSWSLPGKLEKICDVLRMAPEDRKADGDKLIDLFSKPAREQEENTLFGIVGRFNDWDTHPKEWKQFEDYCRQDVVAERSLWHRLNASPLPEEQWRGWFLDQKINERGMPVNRQMAVNGLEMALRSNTEFVDSLKEITQLENPNSTTQLQPWLSARGYKWGSLLKEYVQAELANPESVITPECRAVLKLRQEAAKKSYTKLERLLQVLGPDDRVRYQFRYGGASRTFRWAGADVQTQNLLRPTKEVKKNYQQAIDLIMEKAYEKIKATYPSVVGMVSGSLRMTFQSPRGKKMVVCDLNAIENRALGFLARCRPILEVFELGRDPYIAFAVKLYMRSYEDLMAEYKAGHEDRRTTAKPAVLGAGYGLGPGVKKNADGTYEVLWRTNEFGDKVKTGLLGYAANMGITLTPEEAYTAWKVFRESYPEVVQYWTDLEEAFKQVLKNGKSIRVGEITWNKREHKWETCGSVVEGTIIEFDRKKMRDGGYMVRIHLPSGRCLHYLNATPEEETVPGNDGKPWTRTQIYYDGIEHSAVLNDDGSTARKSNKWGRVKTYGGKLCLAGDALVVTDSGIIPLTNVTYCDKLWDGLEWVNHTGIVYNGEKETITWMGLAGTPDHQILVGSEWQELGKITNRSGLCSLLTGLASVLRLWCSLNPDTGVLDCDAIVGKFSMSRPEQCAVTKSMPALHADANKAALAEPKNSGTTSSSIQNYANYGSENSPTSCRDAITPSVRPTAITEAGALSATNRGGEVAAFGWNMPLRYQDGIIQTLNLIELTTTAITNQGISGSSLDERIQTIAEQLFGFLGMAKSFHMKSFIKDILRNGVRTLSAIISGEGALLSGASADTKEKKVYDISNAGPRHRFTVLTDAGPVIVHNCENIVQAFSRDLLLNGMLLADEMGFELIGCFHDELAALVDDDLFGLGVADLRQCMMEAPAWAPAVPLGAEGFESKFYHK